MLEKTVPFFQATLEKMQGQNEEMEEAMEGVKEFKETLKELGRLNEGLVAE